MEKLGRKFLTPSRPSTGGKSDSETLSFNLSKLNLILMSTQPLAVKGLSNDNFCWGMQEYHTSWLHCFEEGSQLRKGRARVTGHQEALTL